MCFYLYPGRVTSMLVEPRLAVFYSPPEHDLKLNYDSEPPKEEEEGEVIVFPDLQTMFSRDKDYLNNMESLMEYIDNVLSGIEAYAEVNKTCTLLVCYLDFTPAYISMIFNSVKL